MYNNGNIQVLEFFCKYCLQTNLFAVLGQIKDNVGYGGTLMKFNILHNTLHFSLFWQECGAAVVQVGVHELQFYSFCGGN